MTKDVIFIDGPKVGEQYTVRDVNDMVYVAIVDPINVSMLGDISPTYVPGLRKGIYRARRIPRTGHIVHDDQQRAVFEYRGE